MQEGRFISPTPKSVATQRIRIGEKWEWLWIMIVIMITPVTAGFNRQKSIIPDFTTDKFLQLVDFSERWISQMWISQRWIFQIWISQRWISQIWISHICVSSLSFSKLYPEDLSWWQPQHNYKVHRVLALTCLNIDLIKIMMRNWSANYSNCWIHAHRPFLLFSIVNFLFCVVNDQFWYF